MGGRKKGKGRTEGGRIQDVGNVAADKVPALLGGKSIDRPLELTEYDRLGRGSLKDRGAACALRGGRQWQPNPESALRQPGFTVPPALPLTSRQRFISPDPRVCVWGERHSTYFSELVSELS